MSIDQMKDAILRRYPGFDKKLSKMSDKAVYAMYMRLVNKKNL